MNIQKALTIDGWMTHCELEFLANCAAVSKKIVEIGSWMGRSTSALAANTTGNVYAVDTWIGSIEPVHEKILADKTENWLLETFQKNTMDFQNIQTYRMTSLDAAKHLQNEKFDLIFIDASHDYDNVKADILAWKPLLANGGILCGHDYTATWPGVIKAVNECVGNVSTHGTIWSVTESPLAF